METIYQILTFVFGGTSVVGTILSIIWWKQTKRLKEAEVKQKEAEAEKGEAEATEIEDHRFDNLLKLVDSLTSRLSTLNATVDKHIDRNRELSDRLYQSETDKNRLNERIITLTEERDEAIRKAEYDKLWRCERTDCQDPRGPRPPRDKLKGLKYNLPEKA
jgi:hypothetical protein